MKVFVSWSGQRSKAVAELLADWIKCVLQASQPWISTRDIDKGAIWFSEISDQLKDTAAGLVCLTQDNKNNPWILFETGALAKGLTTNRVCTFLVDLKPADVEDPLAQFNHTTSDSSSMWGLVCSLNSGLDASKLNEKILRQVFDTYWPQFDREFKKILKDIPAVEDTKARTDESILGEILSTTRSLASRIRDIELRSGGAPSYDGDTLAKYALIEELASDHGNTIQTVLRRAAEFNVPKEIVEGYLNKYRIIKPSAKASIFKRPQDDVDR